MSTLKLSKYGNNEFIKAEMQRLEMLGKWSIEIDADIDEIRYWTFFIKDNYDDYDNLQEVITTNSNEYESVNGCLINKDRELIFAPKCKRLSLPLKSFDKIDLRYASVWNHVCSLNIRTIFEAFLMNKTLRKYFSDVLMVYRENIVKCVFSKLIENDHLFSIDDFPVQTIEISDDIIWKEYKGISDEQLREFAFEEPDDNHQTENDIEKLRGFMTALYGQYLYDEKKIILYPEAMKTSGENGKNLEDIFLSTLIHEMFHALFHYCYKGDHYKMRADEFNIINESLASAFEKYFRSEILDNQYLADELENEWKRHSVFIYPYSGALVFFDATQKTNHTALMRFRSIRRAFETDGLGHGYFYLEHCYHEYEYYKHKGLTPFMEAFYLSVSNIELAQSRLLFDYFNRYTC
jgi:hypothetical protein